jgi:hypothetical protein
MVGFQRSYSGGVSMSPDRSRVVHFTGPDRYNRGKGGVLHVWDLLPDGTQAKYELVHGCKNRFGFEIASAALLYPDSKRSVEQCGSRVVGVERVLKSDKKRKLSSSGRSSREGQSGCLTSGDQNEFSEATDSMLLMRVGDDFVAELAKIDLIECCRVSNCDERVLVVAEDEGIDGIIVLDALTSEVIHKLHSIEEVDDVWRVAASQTPDGRILVLTGDMSGIVRMRMADSGELIGQWQGLRNCAFHVAIAAKAGMVMGMYEECDELRVWSFGESGPDFAHSNNSPAVADGMHRAIDDLSIFNHSGPLSSVAFTADGKVAVSCAAYDKFVLVWDTATGTVLRRLDIDEGHGPLWPETVAISSSGYWILCSGRRTGCGGDAFVKLWGLSNHLVYFAHVERQSNNWPRKWAATFLCGSSPGNQQQKLVQGAILAWDRIDNTYQTDCGYEMYEWALSRSGLSDPEISITPTTASEDVVSKFKQAQQGGRELLVETGDHSRELHVRNVALDGVTRCTCKAAVVFDSQIAYKSAWSETTANPVARASTLPSVAVGLDDRTVHFLKLRKEEGG